MQVRMEAAGVRSPWQRIVRKIACSSLALALAGGSMPAWAQLPPSEAGYTYLKQSVFRIPIQVAPNKINDIKELRLFVSTDRGRNWQMIKAAKPTQSAFEFQAQTDGEYWFTLATVDQTDRIDPADVRAEPPGIKVIVDTHAPTVDLAPLPPDSSGQAGFRWRIRDDRLDMNSMKVEVQQPGDLGWSDVPVTKTAEGQWTLPLQPGKNCRVRMTVADRAGNRAVATTEVMKESVAPSVAMADESQPRRLPLEQSNFEVPPPPALRDVKSAPASDLGTASSSPTRAPVETMPASRTGAWAGREPGPAGSALESVPVPSAMRRPVDPSAFHSASGPPSASAPLARSRDENRSDRRAAVSPAAVAARPTDPNHLLMTTANKIPIASNRVPPAPVKPKVEPEPAKPAVRRIPLANSTHLSIDYNLKNVGPAGVGKVQLYYTDDNGQSWKLAGDDTDRMPPFDVELPKEGRYGLKLVVTSPAGFGGKPPQKGEPPQMVIEIDTTAPEADLYQPVPDPSGSHDSLLISWSARDAHLPVAPVSLYFAEFPEGPWYSIETGLPAVGQHRWRIEPGMPYQVYLRLVVRDEADNVSIADTPTPVLIDLSRPEAELINIATLPARDVMK